MEPELMRVEKLASLTDEAFIHRAFVNTRGRVCNPEELRRFLKCAQSGEKRSDTWARIRENQAQDTIVADSNGDFYRQLLLEVGDETFIRHAYELAFGREPDLAGRNNYLTCIKEKLSRLEILRAMLLSEEFLSKHDKNITLAKWVKSTIRTDGAVNQIPVVSYRSLFRLEGEQFIRATFKVVLKRDADADGIKTYLAQLADGKAKVRVFAEIAASTEASKQSKTLFTLFFANSYKIVSLLRQCFG